MINLFKPSFYDDKYLKRLSIGVAITLLSNCTSVAPLTENLSDQRLSSQKTITERYHIDTNWWEQYNNPELNQLVKTILDNNIDLKKAAIRLQQSLYQTEQAGVRLLPSYSGSLSASKTRDFKIGLNHPSSYGVQLNTNYEIDFWKKLATAQSAANWEFKASQADLETVKLTLINQAIDYYFLLSYLKESYEINQNNLSRYKKLVDIAAAKYQYGKTSVLPYLQTKQSYLDLQSNLLSLKNRYQQSEQTLKNLLNQSPGEPLNLHFTSLNKVPDLEVDLSVPLSTLANRPDLKASLARLQAAYYRQQSQDRSWYPTISLSTGISSNSQKIGKILSLPIGSASVSINLPFLQWQTMKWQDKQEEANFNSAKLDFEKVLTSALNELDNNYYSYQFSKQQLALSRKKYHLIRRSSKFHKAEYDVGKSELSSYLDVLNSLDGIKNNLLNQRYEVIRTEISVYKTMAGKYWAKHQSVKNSANNIINNTNN